MKYTFIICSGLFLLLSACNSKQCQECVKESYYNGVHYTEKETSGPSYCQEEGESEEDFEKRIKEIEEKGYDCSIKL